MPEQENTPVRVMKMIKQILDDNNCELVYEEHKLNGVIASNGIRVIEKQKQQMVVPANGHGIGKIR